MFCYYAFARTVPAHIANRVNLPDLLDGGSSDGDLLDGDLADGDLLGDALPDGDLLDGDLLDGDLLDGDLLDGDLLDGNLLDGDLLDGDLLDGNLSDGDLSDGYSDVPGLTVSGSAQVRLPKLPYPNPINPYQLLCNRYTERGRNFPLGGYMKDISYSSSNFWKYLPFWILFRFLPDELRTFCHCCGYESKAAHQFNLMHQTCFAADKLFDNPFPTQNPADKLLYDWLMKIAAAQSKCRWLAMWQIQRFGLSGDLIVYAIAPFLFPENTLTRVMQNRLRQLLVV